MSGWSGIYFRYDVEERGYFPGQYKGLVGNHYKGFEPYHIFVRATEGVHAAVACLFLAPYGNLEENIRRTIDVDFVTRMVEIGMPAEVRGKDQNGSSFFFNDCNYYGGCVVDVKGFVNERVEVDEENPHGRQYDLKVKYAFVDDTQCPTKLMTPRQYVEHFSKYFSDECLGEDLMEEIEKILEKSDQGEYGELMTMEEYAEYVSSASVKEYLAGADQ